MLYHLIAAGLVALPIIIIILFFLFFCSAIIGASGKGGGNGPGAYVMYAIVYFIFLVLPAPFLGYNAFMGLLYYFSGDITNAKPYLLFNTTWLFNPLLVIILIPLVIFIPKRVISIFKRNADKKAAEVQKLKTEKEDALKQAEIQKIREAQIDAAKGLRLESSGRKGILTLSSLTSGYIFQNLTVKARSTEGNKTSSKWIMDIPVIAENQPQDIDFSELLDNNEFKRDYEIQIGLGYSQISFHIEKIDNEIKVLKNDLT